MSTQLKLGWLGCLFRKAMTQNLSWQTNMTKHAWLSFGFGWCLKGRQGTWKKSELVSHWPHITTIPLATDSIAVDPASIMDKRRYLHTLNPQLLKPQFGFHLSQRNRFTPSTHWTSQRPLPNMRVIWPYSWRRLANRNPQMEGRGHFGIPTPNPSRPCRWHDS